MKLLRSAKNKITNDGNSENVPYSDITEVVLVHCNIVKNDYQQDSKSCMHLCLINRLLDYSLSHLRSYF